MSVETQGPCSPKEYDTRPTMNGNVLPVLAADAVLAMPCSAVEGSCQAYVVPDLHAGADIYRSAHDELQHHLCRRSTADNRPACTEQGM